MYTVGNITNESLIDLNLQIKSREDAISQLSMRLFHEKKIKSIYGFIHDVKKRERATSTYCGMSIAIPHAVSVSAIEPAFAFGRGNETPWKNAEEQIRFVFLMAIPPGSNRHIDILSSIAELCLEKEIRELWAEAQDKEPVMASFASVINKYNS